MAGVHTRCVGREERHRAKGRAELAADGVPADIQGQHHNTPAHQRKMYNARARTSGGGVEMWCVWGAGIQLGPPHLAQALVEGLFKCLAVWITSPASYRNPANP